MLKCYYYFVNSIVPTVKFLTSSCGHPCRPSVYGVLLLSFALYISGCSEDGWSDKKENFTQTYMEILITREQLQDSTKANAEVAKVMASHGYDQQSFGEQFIEYSRTPEVLKAIMDSAQKRAQRELKR